MKKLVSLILVIAMLGIMCVGCGEKVKQNLEKAAEKLDHSKDYYVGVCQLMKHDSLDQATQGFVDALNEEMEKAGKTVTIDVQIPAETSGCGSVIDSFVNVSKVDLIMANATPALLTAANATATTDIPVLGTSITDYTETFNGGPIPANVTGTSDAVPFEEQAQMMIDTLNLVAGDVVGVLYCTNESNSVIQYEAVKALFEAQGIVVKAYTFSETTELNTIVDNMVANVKAVYIPSDNTVAANEGVVGTKCSAKKIPVYTSYGGDICYAGLAIDYYELGRQTGIMAAQILLGEKKVSDIEIMKLEPTVSYNAALCQQLGIEVPEA